MPDWKGLVNRAAGAATLCKLRSAVVKNRHAVFHGAGHLAARNEVIQMRPRLAAGKENLVIGQLHLEQAVHGIGRCLRGVRRAQPVQTPVMMRDQLRGALCAIEVMPVMAADDLPVFAHIIQPGQIVIIMGQHIPVRVAQADRNIGRNAGQKI